MKVPHRPTIVVGINTLRWRPYAAAKESEVPHTRGSRLDEERKLWLRQVQDTHHAMHLVEGIDFAIKAASLYKCLQRLEPEFDVDVRLSVDKTTVHIYYHKK